MATQPQSPPPQAWLSFAILCLVNALNIYDRQALGAIVEPLRREFHLSDTQVGALPTVFTLVYALAGLPLGRLADTWSRKRLLALGVAVWTALTGLGGLAWSYAALFATRIGVGIGEAVCAPAATSWIGDLFPPARRARAMAGFMMAVPVGVMLSFAIIGPVAQARGWRMALLLAAVPGLALVPALLGMKEPQARSGETARATIQSLLGIRALWWIAASGAIVNFILYSFSTFVAAFLTRFHGLSVARAGVWAGIGSGVAGVLGALAAGALGDRSTRDRAGSRLRLAACAAVLSVPPAAIAVSLPAGRPLGPVASCTSLLMLAYGLLQMYCGLVYAAIQDLVAPGQRGTAMAAYYTAMYLGGGSLGPLLTGGLSDFLARRAAGAAVISETARAVGLRQAMYVVPALSLALAAVLWAAARSAAARPPEPAARPPRSYW